MINHINNMKEKIKYLEKCIADLNKQKEKMLEDHQSYLIDSELFHTQLLVDKIRERIEYESEYFHNIGLLK